jgi:energy-coupling factor transporter ATP-binding protein EcfA2
MQDGFLLPYHALLELGQTGAIDPGDYVVLVPDEFMGQFSYATEHVTNDAALSLLLQLVDSVNRFAALVPGDWDTVKTWLSERIAEVWDARGAYPGLGVALTALGMPQGALCSHGIRSALRDDADPWDLVDAIFRSPAARPDISPRPSNMLQKVWAVLPSTRRDLLKLISRFDLTVEQAERMYVDTERLKRDIRDTDADLLANPYRLYEADRFAPDPISLAAIDRGVFPIPKIRARFPLGVPSRVDDALDERRVRALVVDQLEHGANLGHSLLSQSHVVQSIRERPLDPPCPLTSDIISVAQTVFAPELAGCSMADGTAAYQLARLAATREKIAGLVRRRMGAKPLEVQADWKLVIDALLGASAQDDPDEPLARQEKAAALEALAKSRISVLIGPAGTGKTTLLRALCGLDEVERRGILLIAPTGKARVRMQTAIGKKASTLAQLLVRSGRYDPETGRYMRSAEKRLSGFSTVIVDECSMLTEEQLDALLDGIEGYERLVLVGDPRQLPPIGVGRPFVDIVEFIHETSGVAGFPRVGPSYAELTVKRRQLSTDGVSRERPDLVLADWFSGADIPPGGDSIWDELGKSGDLGTLSVRQWHSSGELHAQLKTELAASLKEMSATDDSLGFQASYGGTVSGDYVYFNITGSSRVEAWQILSPVRGEAGGVNELNRLIQRTYRSAMRDLANEQVGWKRKIPAPVGPQDIIYGDKVINVRNRARKRYWPKKDDALEYVANGEIGIVTGPFRRKGAKMSLSQWEVAFSTQPDLAYKFGKGEFGNDDGSPVLELAYAITVHKAQGSEFGTTFIVMPSPCRLMTRELLYTALTRQQQRVVLFMQGDLAELRELTSPKYSESAARITNLFSAPRPVEIDGRFMEAGLIHHTRKGIHVRSKSEVIIADLLYSKGIDFVYERELVLGGSKRLPDFTIEDADTGETYYWEHLGMLNNASYRRKWEAKRAWYASQGILQRGTGAGEDPEGTLIVTVDGMNGSISSADIEKLVDQVFIGG